MSGAVRVEREGPITTVVLSRKEVRNAVAEGRGNPVRPPETGDRWDPLSSSGPQICLRADRRSAYEQWGLSLPDALAQAFACGSEAIDAGETAEGAKRFAAGRGRGGDFDDI